MRNWRKKNSGSVLTGRAGAILTGAVGTGIVAVATLTGGALVVVAVVLVVSMATMNVVHVIVVDDSLVAAVRAVGVVVGLSGTMLSGDSHGRAPSCG